MEKSKVVLLVDDDPEILQALRRCLRGEPYRVDTADDPALVLERVKHEPVHVVIADQQMPGMLGTELIREVRQCSPATACGILTAYTDQSVLREYTLRRIRRLITKPWRDPEIRRAIRSLIDGDVPSLRVPCFDRNPEEVVDRILDFVLDSAPRGERPCVILEGLSQLRGSAARTLHQTITALCAFQRRMILVDETGYADAFVDALGGEVRYHLDARRA